MTTAALVIVGSIDDPHVCSVLEAVRRTGRRVEALDSPSLRSAKILFRGPRTLEIDIDDGLTTVDSSTTVWYRRPGWPLIENMEPAEASLVASELFTMLPGLFESVGVRWVDSPWAVHRAENKLIQLKEAAECGVRVPDYFVLNDERIAAELLSQGAKIAKPLSSGSGLSPYVAEVESDDLAFLQACPTFLQQKMTRSADLRVVTVDGKTRTWIRPFDADGHVDWRRSDPGGTEFVYVSEDLTNGGAASICERLGLTFSAQDWLMTDDGPVFLEANPQGNWLFLSNAERLILPLFAKHLVG